MANTAPSGPSELTPFRATAALFPNSRRNSAIGLAAMLLAGTAAAFTPPFLASRKVTRFCQEATVGTPRAELEERAEVANYLVQPLASGGLMVEPSGSLGRAYCILRFDADGRLASTKLGQ